MLARPAGRAERRIRLERALSAGTSALCAAFVGAALVLILRKTGHTSERAARILFSVAALGTVASALLAYFRPLAARAGAVALDRYHALSDRLSSALSFSALPAAERTPFMDVAIQDAVRVAATVDPTRAVPFRRPRDAWAALGLALVTVGIGLFEVRHHTTVVAAKTIDAVDVTADDLDAMRDFLKEVEAKDQSEETKAATQEFNQLIQDLAAKRLDRTEAFRRMQALEDKLLQGTEADHKALEAALAKIGEELKKAELTRPAGAALSNDNLADAEKALKDLADRLRSGAKGASKEQLEKMREALKAAAADNAKQQEMINQRREELKKDLLKEKNKQGDAGASEAERSLLQKKERELERLDKEQDATQAAGRQLDRLDRELAQAAEDLLKDLGASAADLDQGAQDINRMAQSEMTQEEKEQMKQKLDELREVLRQQGQGGQQQMVRLRRFQKGAHGQGQQGQGESQGEGQEGQQGEGQGGQAGQGGQQGQQSGHGQGGQGGQPTGQQGQQDQGQGHGQGQGQGGQGQGSGGELWIVGPNGEKILIISRGGAGQGQGMGGGQGENGGGGQGQPGHGWGVGHDEHVQGVAHSIKSGTEDTQVAGQDTGQGGSRSEVIQGAAERGFASKGYTKVYREYHTVAEEALNKDEIPGGYRSYVRRYFELIRPREQK
jgi:hypothetical protein